MKNEELLSKMKNEYYFSSLKSPSSPSEPSQFSQFSHKKLEKNNAKTNNPIR